MNEAQFLAIPDNDRFNRVLNGTAYFASVHAPDYSGQKKFGSDPVFKVSLGLTKSEVAKAESFGLKVKEPTDSIPMPHVVIKRKVKEDKTPEQVKPLVVDSMQKEIPSNLLIGNGSKVAVKFATYWPPNGSEYGAGTTLFKLQVKEFVAYEREDGGTDSDLSIDEKGFSIEDHMSIENDSTSKAPSSDGIFDE